MDPNNKYENYPLPIATGASKRISERYQNLYARVPLCVVKQLPDSRCHLCNENKNVFTCCPFSRYTHRLCQTHLSKYVVYDPKSLTVAKCPLCIKLCHCPVCMNTPLLTPHSPINDQLLTPTSNDDSPHSASSTSSSAATSTSNYSFHATQYNYFPTSFLSTSKPKQQQKLLTNNNNNNNTPQLQQQEQQQQLLLLQDFVKKRKRMLNKIQKLSISSTSLKQILKINDNLMSKLLSKYNRHIEFCFICFKGGELINCYSCPISYHTGCLIKNNDNRYKSPNWICSLCQLIINNQYKMINNPYNEDIYIIIQDILERLINVPEFEHFYKCEFDESTSLKYYTTITYPITLEAVIAKFQSHSYLTHESIFYDIQNLFRNAILFHGKDSELGELSSKLSEYVSLLWCEWLYDIEFNTDTIPIKRKNAYILGMLNTPKKNEKRPTKIIKLDNNTAENKSIKIKNEKTLNTPKKTFPLRNRSKNNESSRLIDEINEEVKQEQEEKREEEISTPVNKFANVLRRSKSLRNNTSRNIEDDNNNIINSTSNRQKIKTKEVTHKKIASETKTKIKVKVKTTKTYIKPKISLTLLQKQYSLSNTIMNYLKSDNHIDFCLICFDGGELIICSKCPSSYHKKCIKTTSKELPDDWICKYCEKEMKGKLTPDIYNPYNDSMFSVAKIILQRLLAIPNMNSFHRLSNEYKEHYYTIIKSPIFLDDIKKKFEEMKYTTTKEIYDDLQLLWSNTRKYNLPKSSISSVALSLAELTSLLWCNFYYDIPFN